MLKEGKIGVFEATAFAAVVISAKILFSSTRQLVEVEGTAAWYGTIISGVVAIAFFFLILLLLKRFPGMELPAIMKAVFGKVIGSVLSLAIFVIFFINAALTLREFAEAVKIYDYPNSPISFIIIFFILAVVVMLRLGLETIARTASFFAWPLLIGLASLFILPAPLYKLHNLFPLLGHGLDKTATNGLLRSSAYGEILALAVISNSIKGLQYVKKTGLMALIISTAILSVNVLCYTLVFPYHYAVENVIPLLTLTQVIEYGAFFQRFESIFLFIWSIATILAVGINLYIALSVYCKVFRMDDHRAIVLPLAILLFCAAIFPPDLFAVALKFIPFLREYGLIIFFGLPVLALLTALARGKKGEISGS